MKNILITGGTIFVSKYVAEYFVKRNYHVFVINRNHRKQCEGVTLVKGDRKELGEILHNYHFDIVLDITAYTEHDITSLLNAIGSFDEYVLISSSAVYPENSAQPFSEETTIGENKIWGKYGTNKIAAENALLRQVPQAYILRPPYLYGSLNNVYREAFVFDCALQGRRFYIPKDGQMNLQFFHVDDLCRFIEIILDKKPDQHIFNVGNEAVISIRNWVKLCYKVTGKDVEFVKVYKEIDQRNYFCFYDYEYYLNVHKQHELMDETKPLEEGLKESFEWYLLNMDEVKKKPYLEFIQNYLQT